MGSDTDDIEWDEHTVDGQARHRTSPELCSVVGKQMRREEAKRRRFAKNNHRIAILRETFVSSRLRDALPSLTLQQPPASLARLMLKRTPVHDFHVQMGARL